MEANMSEFETERAVFPLPTKDSQGRWISIPGIPERPNPHKLKLPDLVEKDSIVCVKRSTNEGAAEVMLWRVASKEEGRFFTLESLEEGPDAYLASELVDKEMEGLPEDELFNPNKRYDMHSETYIQRVPSERSDIYIGVLTPEAKQQAQTNKVAQLPVKIPHEEL